MDLKVVSRFVALSVFAFVLGAVAPSCGSVTSVSDAGSSGAAGSGAGGTGGHAGTTGGGATGGTSVAGNGGGGLTGNGGGGGITGTPDGGPLTCRVDVAGDCPNGFTCACGGPGPGICTCHRNCSDVSQCPGTDPMCGCPSTVGGMRYCVSLCFCTCQ